MPKGVVVALVVVTVVVVLGTASLTFASTSPKPLVRPETAAPPPPPPSGGAALIRQVTNTRSDFHAFTAKLGSLLSFGGPSTKLGRASNGKDIFPNDLAACGAYFARTRPGQRWTLDDCGALYNLQTKRWIWQ